MKDYFKMVGSITVFLLIMFFISWAVMGNSFFIYKVFAPATEQVRRETFEQSKAYNQGMIQELQNMQFEYIKADKTHKDALASIILHRVADYDQNQLPPDLYKFIQELKRERGAY